MTEEMSLGFLAGLLKDKTEECNKLQAELDGLKKSGVGAGTSNDDWKKEEVALKKKVDELTKKLDSYGEWYKNYPGAKKGE